MFLETGNYLLDRMANNKKVLAKITRLTALTGAPVITTGIPASLEIAPITIKTSPKTKNILDIFVAASLSPFVAYRIIIQL